MGRSLPSEKLDRSKIGRREEECQRKRSELVSTHQQLTNYAANSEYDDYDELFMMRHRANSMTASNSASTSRPSPKPDKRKGKVPEYEDNRCGYNEYMVHHYAFAMKAAAKHKLESPTEAARNPRWVEAVGLHQFRTTSLHQRLEGKSAEKPKSAEGPTRDTANPKSQAVNNRHRRPKTGIQSRSRLFESRSRFHGIEDKTGPKPKWAIRKPKPIPRNRRQYRPEAEAGYTKPKPILRNRRLDTDHSKPKLAKQSRSRFHGIEDNTGSKPKPILRNRRPETGYP